MTSPTNHVSGELVQSFRDRLVHLEEQRRACAEEAKAILAEAKAKRLNPKALKEIVKRALETTDERAAREAADAALAEMEAALEALGYGAAVPS